jgi:hypothetical protein
LKFKRLRTGAREMTEHRVMVAGGGILATALTLRQIGAPCGGTFDSSDDAVPPDDGARAAAS